MEIYFSPPSGATVTTFLPLPSVLATSKAAYRLAPEDIPIIIPSDCAKALAAAKASSVVTLIIYSPVFKSNSFNVVLEDLS